MTGALLTWARVLLVVEGASRWTIVAIVLRIIDVFESARSSAAIPNLAATPHQPGCDSGQL